MANRSRSRDVGGGGSKGITMVMRKVTRLSSQDTLSTFFSDDSRTSSVHNRSKEDQDLSQSQSLTNPLEQKKSKSRKVSVVDSDSDEDEVDILHPKGKKATSPLKAKGQSQAFGKRRPVVESSSEESVSVSLDTSDSESGMEKENPTQTHRKPSVRPLKYSPSDLISDASFDKLKPNTGLGTKTTNGSTGGKESEMKTSKPRAPSAICVSPDSTKSNARSVRDGNKNHGEKAKGGKPEARTNSRRSNEGQGSFPVETRSTRSSSRRLSRERDLDAVEKRTMRDTSVDSTSSLNLSKQELARREKYAHVEVSQYASFFNFNFTKKPVGQRAGSKSSSISIPPTNGSIDTVIMSPVNEARAKSPVKKQQQQSESAKPPKPSLSKPSVSTGKEMKSRGASSAATSTKKNVSSEKVRNESVLSEQHADVTRDLSVESGTTTTITGDYDSEVVVPKAVAKKSTSKGSVNLLGLKPQGLKEKEGQSDIVLRVKEALDATYMLGEKVPVRMAAYSEAGAVSGAGSSSAPTVSPPPPPSASTDSQPKASTDDTGNGNTEGGLNSQVQNESDSQDQREIESKDRSQIQGQQASPVHPDTTTLGVDLSSYGHLQLPCLVDSNFEKYRQLTNAHQLDRVSVPLSAPCVSYLPPGNLDWVEIHPRVYSCTTFKFGDVQMGYLRLGPRCVKPLEKSTNIIVCLNVIDGAVKMKSSSFSFNKIGDPFLNSAHLVEGSQVIIPAGAMYSVENWDDSEASLQYAIFRHPAMVQEIPDEE